MTASHEGDRPKGNILLARQFFVSWIWEELSGDQIRVWLWLLYKARFAAGCAMVDVPGGQVSVGRGQLLSSVRAISKGARVGIQTVRSTLARLERDDAIRLETPRLSSGEANTATNTAANTAGKLVTICNYSAFQDSISSPNTAPNTATNTHKSKSLPSSSSVSLRDTSSSEVRLFPVPGGRRRPRTKTDYTPGFQAVWSEYPDKHEKAAAFDEWKKAKLEARAMEVLASLRSQKAEDERKRKEEGWAPGFPYLRRWIKRRRYEDDTTEVSHGPDCTCTSCEAAIKARLTPEQRREIYGDE